MHCHELHVLFTSSISILKFFQVDRDDENSSSFILKDFSENFVGQADYNQNSFFLKSLSTILKNHI